MKKTLIAGIAALFLATGTAHATDWGDLYDKESHVLPKKFWGTWCSIPHEDAWPQAFRRKRPNTDCDYGFKINSTTIRFWDGSWKCRVASSSYLPDRNADLVIGQNKKGERPCFSAEVSYEKKTLFMSKVQP